MGLGRLGLLFLLLLLLLLLTMGKAAAGIGLASIAKSHALWLLLLWTGLPLETKQRTVR